MKFQKYITAVLFVIVLLLAGYVLGEQKAYTVKAASVQQYSYGIYVFGTDTHIWVESDDKDQSTIQDIISKEDKPNIASVFNLLGAVGWRYVNSDKQGGDLTLYVFERPVE